MKTSTLMGCVCGVAAAGVAGYLLGQSRRDNEFPVAATSATVFQRKSAVAVPTSPGIRRSTAVPGSDWALIESVNYRTYLQNLHRMGCPARTIKDILLMDVWALYEQRRAAIDAEYWKDSRIPRHTLAVERQQVLEALFAEVDKLQRNAGSSQDAARVREKYRDQRLLACLDGAGGAPARLADRIDRIDAAELGELQSLGLDAGQLSTTAGLLSPAQKALQATLAPWQPTRQEFDAALRAWQIEQDLLKTAGSPEALLQDPEKKAALDRVREQLVAELGADRFQEYVKVQQPGYRELDELVVDLGLPRDTTGRLSELQTEIRQLAETGQFMGEEGARLKDAYRQQIVALIGEDGLSRLQPASGYLFIVPF
jgi:hypothetical protein